MDLLIDKINKCIRYLNEIECSQRKINEIICNNSGLKLFEKLVILYDDCVTQKEKQWEKSRKWITGELN